jgi:hypothetical protein
MYILHEFVYMRAQDKQHLWPETHSYSLANTIEPNVIHKPGKHRFNKGRFCRGRENLAKNNGSEKKTEVNMDAS